MQQANPEEHWCATLQAAQEMIDAREPHAARLALEQLLSFVHQTWGADDIHLIRPLELIARCHFLEHELLDPNNEAELECRRRALAIARVCLGNDHIEVAELMGKLGNALVIAGSVEDGCALMSESLDIATRLGRVDEFARYLSMLGEVKMAQGRPHEALVFLKRHVAICERDPDLQRLHFARYALGKCPSRSPLRVG